MTTYLYRITIDGEKVRWVVAKSKSQARRWGLLDAEDFIGIRLARRDEDTPAVRAEAVRLC